MGFCTLYKGCIVLIHDTKSLLTLHKKRKEIELFFILSLQCMQELGFNVELIDDCEGKSFYRVQVGYSLSQNPKI